MSTHHYILHYAPDNASLVIRLALEEIGAPYVARLVDRKAGAQQSNAYRRLNPNGLIPVLETPDGPIFETAAILLWLADRHGGLAPPCDHNNRADLLKWLFFMSNTLHPALRMLFYPALYVGEEPATQDALNKITRGRITGYLTLLENRFETARSGLLLDLYLAPMLRWIALYPQDSDRSWFALEQFPALSEAAFAMERRACAKAAAIAEGLGNTPFTNPRLATPPEGSAT